MITLIDDTNNKEVNFHHKSNDKYEVTVGKDQAALSESQIKALRDRLNEYLVDSD